jgi:phosphoribosylanthranilate isomerase
MKLKVCQIRTPRDAFQLLDAGVDYLGMHVLRMEHTEQRTRSANVNTQLRAAGFDGGVVLTKVTDLDWICETTRAGSYRYVQLHCNADLSTVAELSIRLSGIGSSLIQVVDPTIRDGAYVESALEHAEFVLYDNYEGGTGRQLSDAALNGLPMDRAFIAGGVDDCRARELRTRFSPYAVDVQSWVSRNDKSKDIDKVKALLEIAKS